MCALPMRACASARRPARDSYLNIPQIVAACEITGADAVHPGYGFLSENAKFAEILEEHGITFIGPTADHIRIMGDKIEAKKTAKAGHSGGSRLRGRRHHGRGSRKIAKEIGYPVLIKATAGGGGRGMKVANNEDDSRWRCRRPARKPGGVRQ
jgi:acetyl-CoA carboxylase biotin carboxylase subunit